MFFVLEGSGELRLGQAVHAVRPGDVIACRRRRGERAPVRQHRRAPLRVLAVSTMDFPELCEYPDSGKFLAVSGTQPDDLRISRPPGSSLDYWDGEA